jgi:tripartite-type tricarboxylate transporter receptor subunit TctC
MNEAQIESRMNEAPLKADGRSKPAGIKWRRILAAACVLFLSGTAGKAAPFAGGKITLAINSASGGGYDAYARLVARHLGKYLEGDPVILPTNMPGAGGLIATNWLYNVAPKDGSAIGIFAASAIFAPFLGAPGAKYDAGKFNWLMSLDNYNGVGIVYRDAPVQKAADLFTHELIVAAGGEGSDVTIWPKLIKSILGAKLKIVRGYNGAGAFFLALERGEAQSIFGLNWTSIKAQKADWLADKTIRPIVQIATQRHPELADVPTVLELAKDEESRAVLDLFIARQTYSRPFVAPPGTPPEAVASLRRAFEAMVKDPVFLQEAQTSGLDINVTTGVEMKSVIDRVLASPRPVVARAIAELNAN